MFPFFLQYLLECLSYQQFRFQVQVDIAHALDVLNQEPVYGEDWNFLSGFPVDVLTLEAIIYPGFTHKIDCFSYVKASREACMIGSWEGQDELTWHLKGFVDFNL
jgi:hypothetical protein